MIQFACPTCSTTLRADDSAAGSKVICPRCNQRVAVPPPPITKTTSSQPREDEPTIIPPLSLDELHRPPPRKPEPPPEPRTPPRQSDPLPPRIPSREYDDYEYDEDEPRPRRSWRPGGGDRDDDDDRPGRRRPSLDRGYAGDPGPGGAAVTGLVLSCIGAFFALAAPLSCGATFSLGFPLSVAGFITSLCGRSSSVRTLGIVFGAIGFGLSLLMFAAISSAVHRRF